MIEIGAPVAATPLQGDAGDWQSLPSSARGRWWSRHWRFAELDKLQALQLTQSPFDRRHGMATLWLDTAGAGALSPPLCIRYIAQDDARALFDRLGAEVASRRLRG